MKIENVRVYGLEESIIASGYPMKTKLYSEDEFTDECNALAYAWDIGTEDFNEESKIKYEKDIKRAINLGSVESGTAHDNYLKGIIVQYDLTAPEYFWRQFDRYHFHDYVSSQSKMHCILKFDIEKMCNEYVDERVIDVVNEYISIYNDMVKDNLPKERLEEVFQYIISNIPMGLELTARITDNYLQLKSKYKQRRHHKLRDWRYYCDWIRTLPMFTKIVLKEE